MTYFFWYLLVINVISFVVRGWDKRQAVGQKWRISERRLLELCAVGWWLGGLLGMQLFRHKTVKGTFLYWFYGIVVVWIVGIVLLMYNSY
jgi:uncharacterized membrane protein YsdA (DUF1294 family)